MIQGMMQQNYRSPVFNVKNRCAYQIEPFFLQPPNYLIILLNQFRYINNNIAKIGVPKDRTISLGNHKFGLQAPIDHDGHLMYSGHYTYPVAVAKRNLFATTTNLLNMKEGYHKTPHSICSNLNICYTIIVRLEHEGGSLFTPIALTHHLHPIRSRSRNKRRNLYVG